MDFHEGHGTTTPRLWHAPPVDAAPRVDPEACIEALIAALGAVDVAQALLACVDGTSCAGMRVYRVEVARGLMSTLAARGDDGPTVLPQGDVAAWRAVHAGAPVAEPGRVAWPLRAGDEVVGVAVITGEPDATLVRLLRLAGPALRRAVVSDRARFDAAVLEVAQPILEDGLMVVTLDGEVRHYNDALAALSGWSGDEVRKHGWTNLVYATPEERAAAQTAIAALLMGRPSEGTRRTLVRKGGERYTAGIWSRIVSDPAGGAPGLLGVLRDVSREVDRAREVTRADGLAHLGRMARWVAHDVNNLLCAVAGHAELIELWSKDARVLRSARTVRESVEHGARMTRQLLVSGGAGEARRAPVRMARLVRETCDLFAASVPRALRVDVAVDAAAVVDADVGQLHQALLNLLTNAAQACGPTGVVRVRVELATLPADVTWRAATAPSPGTLVVRLSVHDTGPGFPTLDPDRLFEPYFTTRREGHGVGLAAVRGIVANHDGAVNISNDHGARVELFLLASDRPEIGFDDLALARGAAPGRRVWMHDDQAQILEFSRISLAARGLVVRDFTSGAALVVEAARTAAGDRPDVLVLDDPHQAGASLLAELRAAGLTARVLWISGDTRDLPAPLSAEGRFLAKPFTGRALADAVIGMLTD